MRLIGFLIITVSLVFGVVGAVTAYLPRLNLADHRLVNLTLAANAGWVEDAEGQRRHIGRVDEKVTTEMLEALRAAKVSRIKVKEFSLVRWSESWLFVLGCMGLITGALFVRMRSKPAVSASADETKSHGDAAAIVAELKDRLAALRRELGELDERAAVEHVLSQIGAMQRDLIPAFIAARQQITASGGLAGFAQVMDAFAAAERQINRAWSAAADHVMDESTACIDRAAELLNEVDRRLRA